MAGGLRFNKGKIKLSLCPTSTIAAVASTLQTNSESNNGKYPDNNWRKGMKWSIVIDCLQRHLEDFKNGEDVDEEDGIPTIWKVLTNAAFLVEYSQTCPELDDRFSDEQFKLRDFPKIAPLKVEKQPELAVKCTLCNDTGFVEDCCSSSLTVYKKPCNCKKDIMQEIDKAIKSLEIVPCKCGMVCNCDEKFGTKQCGEDCKCKK